MAPTAAASIISAVQLKQSFFMFLPAGVEFIVYITFFTSPPFLCSLPPRPSAVGGAQHRPQCNTRAMAVKTSETQWIAAPGAAAQVCCCGATGRGDTRTTPPLPRLKALCPLNSDSRGVIHRHDTPRLGEEIITSCGGGEME